LIEWGNSVVILYLEEVFLMKSDLSENELAEFLILAKKNAYASGGSASSASVDPVLQDSHQLEFRSGDLLYRDIYFGEAFFAGQETVYENKNALWSMSYAGGWTEALIGLGDARILGGFLQSALREVPPRFPFRGPIEYSEDEYRYKNYPKGDINRFKGNEQILIKNQVVYKLNYCGGRLS
jgi:hypothetical protein